MWPFYPSDKSTKKTKKTRVCKHVNQNMRFVSTTIESCRAAWLCFFLFFSRNLNSTFMPSMCDVVWEHAPVICFQSIFIITGRWGAFKSKYPTDMGKMSDLKSLGFLKILANSLSNLKFACDPIDELDFGWLHQLKLHIVSTFHDLTCLFNSYDDGCCVI